MSSWIRRSVARRVALVAAAMAAGVATLVGLAVVMFVLRDVPAATRRDMMLVAVLGGAASVASVAVGTVLIVNRILTSALRDLTGAIRLAEKGKWLRTARAGTPGARDDEIGELMRAFDRLCTTVTDLSVAVIDSDRELAWTRRELRLKDALSLLFELTQTLSSETDLDAILNEIPRQVAPALGFDEMAVLLYDEAALQFVVRGTYGIPEAMGVSFPRDDSIAGVVADTGEPLVIPDTTRDPRYSHFKGRHPLDGAFACVPMRVHGRLLGMFNVLRPEKASIGEADLRLLSSIAAYTGLAIVHLEMNQRLRDLSVTDELTGVANRRSLMDKVARELEREQRTERPLAALMIDLDHFKKVNDELGHMRGDEVLRAVARVLFDNVRRLDMVARYGGEEFCILLPDADRAQALLVAEKLRAAVSALEVLGVRLTISVGVASYPGDADGGQALIDAADRALLVAKRTGRDRVIAFERGAA